MRWFWVAIPMLMGCGGESFSFFVIEGGALEGDSAIDGSSTSDAPEIDASRDGELTDAGTLEVSTDASILDAPDSNMCPYSGPTECGAVVDAYCTHYASCCSQFPGNGACSSWGASSVACKTHWNGSGFDCDSQKYSPNICAQSTACKNEIVSVSCSSIFSSVSPASSNFSSCPGFWGQF